LSNVQLLVAWGSITGRDITFSLVHGVQTGSGAHLDSYIIAVAI
jgi:hypothetical protein